MEEVEDGIVIGKFIGAAHEMTRPETKKKLPLVRTEQGTVTEMPYVLSKSTA